MDHAFGGVKADAQVVDPEHDVSGLAVRCIGTPARLDLDRASPRCPAARMIGRFHRLCGAAPLTEHNVRLS